jgi:hypothetical protein
MIGGCRLRCPPAMAITALGRACVRGGTSAGPLGSSLGSRTKKKAVDVGFQVVHPAGQYSKKCPQVVRSVEED